MSITATYVDATAKVTVAVTGAPSLAQTVLIERSTDQVTWAQVRGAQSLTLTGGAVSFDDYEFTDGVVNYYRATYLDATAPVYVASGAVSKVTSAGATVSATPALPAGVVDGHTVFVMFGCSKSTATVSSVTAGWSYVGSSGSFAIYAARWFAGIVAPTVTMGGAASGDVLVAKTFSYRNVSAQPAFVNGETNAAATTIPFQAAPSGVAAWIVMYQKSKNTSVTPAATTNDTDGTSYSLLAYHGIAPPWPAGSVSVAGGSAAVSYSAVATLTAVGQLATRDTATVTPALSIAWMKNPLQPYLNRPVTITNIDTITNPARSGVFDVPGREMPIAVTDVFGSRKTSITLRTVDEPTMVDIHDCLMTGEVQFLHGPKGSRTPTGYYVLGDLGKSFPSQTGQSRLLTFAITEVAAPDPTLAPVLSTWQTVINTYATWADLIAAKATWADVLQLVGSPSDILTG